MLQKRHHAIRLLYQNPFHRHVLHLCLRNWTLSYYKIPSLNFSNCTALLNRLKEDTYAASKVRCPSL